MEFNKIAAAVIMSMLIVMVISKVGNFLVPTETTEASAVVDTGGQQQQQQPEVDRPFTDYLADASADRGESIANNCLSCHTLNEGGPNRQGPNLYGVVGRQIGSEEGFSYSPGLAEAQEEWSYQKLFEFLKNPQAAFAGAQMFYRLPNPEQRANVILYLRTLNDNPPDLPEPTDTQAEQDAAGDEAQNGEQPENGQAQNGEQPDDAQNQGAQGQDGQNQGDQQSQDSEQSNQQEPGDGQQQNRQDGSE